MNNSFLIYTATLIDLLLSTFILYIYELRKQGPFFQTVFFITYTGMSFVCSTRSLPETSIGSKIKEYAQKRHDIPEASAAYI